MPVFAVSEACAPVPVITTFGVLVPPPVLSSAPADCNVIAAPAAPLVS